MGNYVMTSTTYCRGVEANENTKFFVDGYIKRFGEMPTYTSGTFDAIFYNLAPAIEQAGTLDPDTLVSVIEEREYKSSVSNIKYQKNPQGKPIHDITWGPGYSTGLVIQWQGGTQKGVWPNKWKLTPNSPGVTYKGMVPIKIPPWMIEYYKK
jgi:branched-chain amino acid transport system substrate-binding protein